MAKAKDQDKHKAEGDSGGKKPSIIALIVPVALVTLLAGGGGFTRETLCVMAARRAFEAVEHDQPARIGAGRALDVDVDEVAVRRGPALAPIRRRRARSAA